MTYLAVWIAMQLGSLAYVLTATNPHGDSLAGAYFSAVALFAHWVAFGRRKV